MSEGADHDALHHAFQVLGHVVDRLALARLISAGDRYSENPPNCWMPTSKVTRVRSDGFSKIIASVSPFNALYAPKDES